MSHSLVINKPLCACAYCKVFSFFIQEVMREFEHRTSLAASVVVSTVGLSLHSAHIWIFRSVTVVWQIRTAFSFRVLGTFCVEKIPQGIVGGVIGGTMDLVETEVIAKRAYKLFLEGDISCLQSDEDDIVVDEKPIDSDNSEI